MKSNILSVMIAIVAFCALALPALAEGKPATTEASSKPATIEVDPFCPTGPELKKDVSEVVTETCPDGKTKFSFKKGDGTDKANARRKACPTFKCPDGSYTFVGWKCKEPANKAPVPDETVSCTALTCEFDGSLSDDDEGGLTHTWEFGDKTRDSGEKVTKAFKSPGTYSYAHKVKDAKGKTASKSGSVTVTETPAPPPPPKDPPVARVTTQCTDLSCKFDASTSTCPDGPVVTTSWGYSDSTAGSGPVAVKVFPKPGIFSATAKVTCRDGRSDDETVTVTVPAFTKSEPTDQKPVARLEKNCATGTHCVFSASGSTDDAGIVSYSLDTGDGSPKKDSSFVEHDYAAPGTYVVTLVVTDTKGQTDDEVVSVTVPETPKPPSGPSLFDGKNFYLGLEAFVAGKFGAPYVVGPEGEPADRTVRPFGVGALGIPRLTLGLMSEETIVAVSGFVAPYSVLEFAQDDARAWQPYPGLMAGGGVKVLTRPSDNFAWGGEVQAVFHATGLDVESGNNALSSWAVMAGPTVSITLMRLEGIGGRIELNGSLLAGYEQGWTTVNDMPTQYPGTFVAMPSLGLGFSFGGATKPLDTGYHK